MFTKVEKFMDFNRRRENRSADEEYELYEDTHNEKGEYVEAKEEVSEG